MEKLEWLGYPMVVFIPFDRLDERDTHTHTHTRTDGQTDTA